MCSLPPISPVVAWEPHTPTILFFGTGLKKDIYCVLHFGSRGIWSTNTLHSKAFGGGSGVQLTLRSDSTQRQGSWERDLSQGGGDGILLLVIQTYFYIPWTSKAGKKNCAFSNKSLSLCLLYTLADLHSWDGIPPSEQSLMWGASLLQPPPHFCGSPSTSEKPLSENKVNFFAYT